MAGKSKKREGLEGKDKEESFQISSANEALQEAESLVGKMLGNGKRRKIKESELAKEDEGGKRGLSRTKTPVCRRGFQGGSETGEEVSGVSLGNKRGGLQREEEAKDEDKQTKLIDDDDTKNGRMKHRLVTKRQKTMQQAWGIKEARSPASVDKPEETCIREEGQARGKLPGPIEWCATGFEDAWERVEDLDSNLNEVLIPAGSNEASITIRVRDLRTLGPEASLNQEIIEWWLAFWKRHLNDLREEGLLTGKVWVANTYFYAKLTEGKQYNYTNVQRWTTSKKLQEKDVFEYNQLLIPIHIPNEKCARLNHWILACIRMSDREICFFDSVNGRHMGIYRNLVRWLGDEYADKKGKAFTSGNGWVCKHIRVPQQENDYDCGLFLCVFAAYQSINRKCDFEQKDITRFRTWLTGKILESSQSAGAIETATGPAKRRRRAPKRWGTFGDECQLRRADFQLCGKDCGCFNTLNGQVWVKVVQVQMLGGEQREVVAARACPKGQVLTCFGDAAVISDHKALCEQFQALQRANPKAYRFSFSASNTEGVTKSGGPVWVIPPEDIEQARRQLGPKLKLLRETLEHVGPPGVGHIINHTCDKNEVNVDVRLMKSADEEENMRPQYVLTVIARKDIEIGEKLLWNYNGGEGRGQTPFFDFVCECSQCSKDVEGARPAGVSHIAGSRPGSKAKRVSFADEKVGSECSKRPAEEAECTEHGEGQSSRINAASRLLCKLEPALKHADEGGRALGQREEPTSPAVFLPPEQGVDSRASPEDQWTAKGVGDEGADEPTVEERSVGNKYTKTTTRYKSRDSNAPLDEESTEVDQKLVLSMQVENSKSTPESSDKDHNASREASKRLYHSEGALGPEKACFSGGSLNQGRNPVSSTRDGIKRLRHDNTVRQHDAVHKEGGDKKADVEPERESLHRWVPDWCGPSGHLQGPIVATKEDSNMKRVLEVRRGGSQEKGAEPDDEEQGNADTQEEDVQACREKLVHWITQEEYEGTTQEGQEEIGAQAHQEATCFQNYVRALKELCLQHQRGVNEDEMRNEYRKAVRWMKNTVTPWARRHARGRFHRCCGKTGSHIKILFRNVQATSKQEAIQLLEEEGVVKVEEEAQTVFNIRKSRGRRVVATEVIMLCVVNEGLARLWSGQAAIRGRYVTCTTCWDDIAPEGGDVEDTLVLTPGAGGHEEYLRGWMQIMMAIGAQEFQVIEMIVHAVRNLRPEWDIRECKVWASGIPVSLSGVWGNKEGSQGHLRLRGKWGEPRSENKYMTSNAWAIAGRAAFQQRDKEAKLKLYPDSAGRQVAGAVFELCNLTAEAYNWCEEAPEWAEKMSVLARCEPMFEQSQVERESSVCIRMKQTSLAAEQGGVREARHIARQQVVELLNCIQRRHNDTAPSFTMEEVGCWGFQTSRSEGRCMITIRKRQQELMESDVLTGATLGFIIGQNCDPDGLKWCPFSRQPGESLCGITSISTAVRFQGAARRSVFFGTQIRGQEVWDMSNQRDPNLRRFMQLLKSGKGQDLLTRIRSPGWIRHKEKKKEERARKWQGSRGFQVPLGTADQEEGAGARAGDEGRKINARQKAALQRIPRQSDFWSTVTPGMNDMEKGGDKDENEAPHKLTTGSWRELKRNFLMMQGDWAGANAVTGDWVLSQLPAGRGQEWNGAEAVATLCDHIQKGKADLFLAQLREKGHVSLANEGERLLGSNHDKTTGISTQTTREIEHWMLWLEHEMRFQRPSSHHNCITWNVGPLGYYLSRTPIFSTLKKGAPIVMFQEIFFPPSHKRRIKIELKQLFPEYLCYINIGRSGDRVTEASGGRQGSGQSRSTVMTCLHRAAFTKAQKREWATKAEDKLLRHMAHGRVLWLRATTVGNKSVHIVNVHQATSGHTQLQQKVWDRIARGVSDHKEERILLGGDLNANAGGPRVGYTPSNQAHMEEVDEILTSFVESTGGQLISPSTPSRVDTLRDKRATLDHIILWPKVKGSHTAQVEWVGSATQDHGRVGFKIVHDNIPEGDLTWTKCADTIGPPRYTMEWWRSKEVQINQAMEEKVQEVQRKMRSEQMSPQAGKDCILEHRILCAKKLGQSNHERKWIQNQREPHRSRAQREVLRQLAGIATALKHHEAGAPMSKASMVCWEDSEIQMEMHISKDRLSRIFQTAEWRDYLLARQKALWQSLTNMQDKQLRETKSKLDKEILREFLDTNKGPSKFSGKFSAQVPMNGIQWTVPQGVMWMWDQKEKQEDRFQNTMERLKGFHGIQVLTHTQEEGTVTLMVEMEEGCREICKSWVRETAPAWFWNAADKDPETFIREVSVEVCKRNGDGMGPFMNETHFHEEMINAWERNCTSKSWLPGREGLDLHDCLVWVTKGNSAEVRAREWHRCLQEGPTHRRNPFEYAVDQHHQIHIKHRESGRTWALSAKSGEVISTTFTERVASARQEGRKQSWPFKQGRVLGQQETSRVMVAAWVEDLGEVQRFLEATQALSKPGDVMRKLIFGSDLWKEDNQARALECYFQEQGLAHHSCCQFCGMKDKNSIKPHVLPLDNRRREDSKEEAVFLQGFCQRCWQVTNLRQGRDIVGDTDFLEKAGVFAKKIAAHKGYRLRGEITKDEMGKYVKNYLKAGKAGGLDGATAETLKSMSDEEMDIMRLWVNSILTTEKSQQSMTAKDMLGRIRMLHKGGSTAHKPSDWRPVVLLNTVNQLVMHILNQRLKGIVEKEGWLEAGQAGSRTMKGTDVNWNKLEHVIREAKKQGKMVLRADVDFKNAYNAMSQAALWHIMKEAGIPDVDLLENLYANSTVQLHEVGGTGATVTFDTGVAQGSALSPLLFIIFMNILLRLLTNTGLAENIHHGLKGLQPFNNVAFVDDLSVLAQSSHKMQRLLEVIHEFQEWCGLKVNTEKTIVMVINRPEHLHDPEVCYEKRRLRCLKSKEPCRYLGFWATADGDMNKTKEIVFQKTELAVEMLEGHPLPPDLAVELFKSKALGVFRYSAPFVPWTEQELERLKILWCKGYKRCWKVPYGTASAAFILPQGLGLPTPLAILAQASLQHIERIRAQGGWQQEQLFKEMQAAIAQKACGSWQDLQEEMRLWKWDHIHTSKWLRTAKMLNMLDLSISWSRDGVGEEPLVISWAKATRELRWLRHKVEEVGGCKQLWNDQLWDLDREDWQLLWAGEEDFWKHVQAMVQAGFSRPALCPQELREMAEPEGLHWTELGKELPKGWRLRHIPQLEAALACSHRVTQEEWVSWRRTNTILPIRKYDCVKVGDVYLRPSVEKLPKIPGAVRFQGSSGVQWVRILIPETKKIPKQDRKRLQRWLDLVDWKVQLEVTNHRRQKEGIRQHMESQMSVLRGKVRRSHSGWNFIKGHSNTDQEAREPQATSRGAVSQRMQGILQRYHSEGFSGDAEDWVLRMTQMHPKSVLQSVWSVMWQGKVTGKHIETLGGWIAERLPPGWSTKWRQQFQHVATHDSLEVTKGAVCRWNASMNMSCEHCMAPMMGRCAECQAAFCNKCTMEQEECPVCDKERNVGGPFKKADRRTVPDKRKRQRAGPGMVARNVHNTGEIFISQVVDVRQAQNDTNKVMPGEHLEFLCHMHGTKLLENKATLRDMQEKTDETIRRWLLRQQDTPLLHLPRKFWPTSIPPRDGIGWWYQAKNEIRFKTCVRCFKRFPREGFLDREWSRGKARCLGCDENDRPAKRRTGLKDSLAGKNQGAGSKSKKSDLKKGKKGKKVAQARCRSTTTVERRRSQRSATKDPVVYREDGSSQGEDDRADEEDTNPPETGMVCMTADPRCLDFYEHDDGADVVLNMHEIRGALAFMSEQANNENSTYKTPEWLSTAQMGWALGEEPMEVDASDGVSEQKQVARFLAPKASKYIRERWEAANLSGQELSPAQLEAIDLDNIWGKWEDEEVEEIPGRKLRVEKEEEVKWEQRDIPAIQQDPPRLKVGPESSRAVAGRSVRSILLQAPLQQGYVTVIKKSAMWAHHGVQDVHTLQGLTSYTILEHTWTIMCGLWNHLLNRSRHGGKELALHVRDEVVRQESLEEQGYRSPSWRVLKALQAVHGARVSVGETAVGAAPMFQSARRGKETLWGDNEGPMVVLWDSLDEQGKKEVLADLDGQKDWVLWKKVPKTKEEWLEDNSLTTVGVCIFKGNAKQGGSVKVKGWWKRGDIKTAASKVGMQCWIHTEGAEKLRAQAAEREQGTRLEEVVNRIEQAWKCEQRSDEYKLTLQGPEQFFWRGSEAGLLGIFDFPGILAGGDGSEDAGKMGAGVWCWHDRAQHWGIRVGREEEGSNSKRPELAALASFLRSIDRTCPCVYLCDNAAVLDSVDKWIGEGGKASLAKDMDEDIMREVLQLLHDRIQANAATILVKVKSHRGEPVNEYADVAANKGRQEPDDSARWSGASGRLVFTVRKEDSVRYSTWRTGVKNAIKGKAGEWEIQQQLQEAIRIRKWHATGGASSQCERKLGVSRWWAATKQEKEIYANREFLENTWGRTCFEWLQETAPNQKAGATWCATFLLRVGLSREELTKWLRNKGVTWKKKRRLIQAITLTFPCSKWLCRIGSKSNAECALCERYQRNLNPDARQRTAIGTFGHIQSAGCLGTREAVIAAHNKCLNGLMEDICKHQVKRCALRLIAEDKDKSLRSLWEDKALQRICSQKELWAAAAEGERKRHQEMREQEGNEISEEEMEAKFWRRRPDRLAINEQGRILYLIEFKRTMDIGVDFAEQAALRANNQYENLRGALEEVGREGGWQIKQINIIGGTLGSVHVESFEETLKVMEVGKKEWPTIRKRHVRRLLEAQDAVLLAYYGGFQKEGSVTVRHHLGQDIYG